MKIGITGINGLLGNTVSKNLKKNGHIFFSLDDLTRKECSVNKIQQSDCYPLDWILHFGSKTSINDSFADPFDTIQKNINSTLTALKIAEYSESSFLFMSSFVYGEPNYSPIDEQHPVYASNPYMSSKVIGEEASKKICQVKGIPLVILRGSNIFGKTLIPGRLISDLLISKKNNEYISINDPDSRRDYLYIKDFYELILKIIEQDPILEGIYNLGSGESYSNLEVAQIFSNLIGNKNKIKIRGKKRKNDILDASLDVNLIKKTFSWSPKYTLKEGLEDILSI